MNDQNTSAEASETMGAITTAIGSSDIETPTGIPDSDAFTDSKQEDLSRKDDLIRKETSRPADVPEKFWDQETDTLRTQSLLKSYLELEKKLGTMVPVPNDEDPSSRHRLQRILGKPDSPDDYQIEAPHELIAPDKAINAKLHEAGLSAEQAQLVYDLAAEHLVPMAEEINNEARQKIEQSKLAAHFGGEQKWQTIAPQLKTWAEANLPDDVFESLVSSFDGVIAIQQMMQAREPHLISESAVPSSSIDEKQLSQMMRDPRYWRDRDPAFVAEVTAGYRRLFG
jgi:hypothetical protein